MANYDRRILVPYLRDICSVEMLCSVLVKEINTSMEEVKKLSLETNKSIQKPNQPVPHGARNTGYILLIVIFGIVPLILSCLTSKFERNLVPIIVGAALFVFSCLIWGTKIRKNNKQTKLKNSAENEIYQKKLAHYEKETARIAILQKQQLAQLRYLDTLKNRLQTVQKLRNDVYSVNIIPARYRDIQTAYYLYDYANSSRETDVDRIIQIMLLDELMQRPNHTVMPKEESIIGQRMQLAQHESQNKILTEATRKELQSLARTEKNPQLHLDYLDMIEKNTNVTNFFLETDYLHKYH